MTKQNMLPVQPKMVTFSLTIEEAGRTRLMAFMSSDSWWERAEKVRHATIQECTKSLEHCVRWAERDCGSSRVFAQFFASLYNGYRAKADVSDIGAFDPGSFEHLMNVLRLWYMSQREPHITAAGHLRGISVSGIWRKNAMGKPIECLGGAVDTNKMHGKNDHANSHFQSNLAARKGGLTEPCRWLAL